MKVARPTVNAGSRMWSATTQTNCKRERKSASSSIRFSRSLPARPSHRVGKLTRLAFASLFVARPALERACQRPRQRAGLHRPKHAKAAVDNSPRGENGTPPACMLAATGLMGAAMTDTTAHSESFLDRYFGLKEHGTDVRTEVIAGFTTFLTMVYIVFVNPQILGNAGMDKSAVFVATCIAAAVSALVMGLYANYPIALAPGMGLNAFFAFTVVLSYKYTWQQALAAVFCSGVVFFLISVFRIREYIINSIPRNMKLAISAGVGLFLGIIALEEAKIVVAHPATLVTLGDLKNPAAILCLLGFVLIAALNYRNV